MSDQICSSWYLVRISCVNFNCTPSTLLSASSNFFSACSCISFSWSFLYNSVNLSKSFSDQLCFLVNNSLTLFVNVIFVDGFTICNLTLFNLLFSFFKSSLGSLLIFQFFNCRIPSNVIQCPCSS